MRNLVKNAVKVAAVAATVWAVKKFELDKKLKDKWEKSKYAQVPVVQDEEDDDGYYDDYVDNDDEDDYIAE